MTFDSVSILYISRYVRGHVSIYQLQLVIDMCMLPQVPDMAAYYQRDELAPVPSAAIYDRGVMDNDQSPQHLPPPPQPVLVHKTGTQIHSFNCTPTPPPQPVPVHKTGTQIHSFNCTPTPPPQPVLVPK